MQLLNDAPYQVEMHKRREREQIFQVRKPSMTKEKLETKANTSIVILKSCISGSNNGNALVNLILNLPKYGVEKF